MSSAEKYSARKVSNDGSHLPTLDSSTQDNWISEDFKEPCLSTAVTTALRAGLVFVVSICCVVVVSKLRRRTTAQSATQGASGSVISRLLVTLLDRVHPQIEST